MDYKLLTFDLGGVCFFTNLEAMNLSFQQETGISFRPLNGGTYPFYYSFDLGQISIDQYFKELKQATGSSKSISDLRGAYKRAYLETSRLNFKLLEKLSDLSTRHRVVCASTTNAFHEEINRERGMFNCFNTLYFSHHLGLLGKEFVRRIVDLEKVNPSQVIMVDNDLELLAYGKSFGEYPLFFENNTQLFRELKARGIT
ncbi:TPA: hypothetical protein HA371_05020 [Candidatus Woesearchaeota archaeon]|nr:hypothetical protein [Candidatus Woesearchaeota archaeon]